MYSTTIKLNHNEIPTSINVETGEIKEIKRRVNNIPKDKEVFEPKALFKKNYSNSWKFLTKELTPIEFKVTYTLALMAKANTNSLEPLNDDTTIPQLMEVLNVSKNKVKPILDKLWNYGVYGKFDVKDFNTPYTKYWIFNPYLSFSGKLLHSDISKLFRNTHCARAFYDEYYRIR